MAAFPKLRAVRIDNCEVQVDEKEKLLKTPGNSKCIDFNCCALVREAGGGKELDILVEEFDFTWNGLSKNRTGGFPM